MSPEMQYLWILSRGLLARARDDERGVSTVEWVIITAALILIAGIVVTIIQTQVTNKANTINIK